MDDQHLEVCITVKVAKSLLAKYMIKRMIMALVLNAALVNNNDMQKNTAIGL